MSCVEDTADHDLLRFLCSVRIVEHGTADATRCTLTQLPPIVCTEMVIPGVALAPSLSLGVVYPVLRSFVASLGELQRKSRTELQVLARACRLSIAQSMALFGAIANMQESLPNVVPPSIMLSENDIVVLSRSDAQRRDTPEPLQVVCRSCNPNQHRTVAPSINSMQARCADEVPLIPQPPAYTRRVALRRCDALDAAGGEPKWSLKTQLCSALFQRTYRPLLPEGDAVLQWEHIYGILKEEKVTPHHLTVAYEWWRQCSILTADAMASVNVQKMKRPNRRRRRTPATFRGPSIAQFLCALDKGAAGGARLVLSHYSPHGGPHVVALDAAVMRSPANSNRDDAFWKLFDISKSVPGVVSLQELEREWKHNPLLAFPFLGYTFAAAPPVSFVDEAELRLASPQRRKKKRLPIQPHVPSTKIVVH